MPIFSNQRAIALFIGLLWNQYHPSLLFSYAQQPNVTTLERSPARRASGVITLPRGSPWCQGQPTIWIPGHKDYVLDRPVCKGIDGKWRPSQTAVMDIVDDLNRVDNNVIDRHDCGVIDANNDGLPDIYCLVGANRGRGLGFNELYLTRQDGSLFKMERHALQRFTGARTRYVPENHYVHLPDLSSFPHILMY